MEALASERPTPGGGSAATLVTALGAALVAMVARLTHQNAKHAAHHALAAEIATKADGVRARALRARTEDEVAYGGVVTATGLPRSTPDERSARTAAIQAALGDAARAPLHAAELAKLVAILTARALELGLPPSPGAAKVAARRHDYWDRPMGFTEMPPKPRTLIAADLRDESAS